MTINEAIEHARRKAQELGCSECGAEHLQLAQWLEELVSLRKSQEEAYGRMSDRADRLYNTQGLDCPDSVHRLARTCRTHYLRGAADQHRTEARAMEELREDMDAYAMYCYQCGLGKTRPMSHEGWTRNMAGMAARTGKNREPEDGAETALHDIIRSIADKAKPLDGDIAKFVDENFWTLI